ncbi:MAG: NBR1-Ig-like domain-containing protein [Spirochaetaceae bacterium]|nr:NBR1-Ig-like domain-containing protein [Spirochaetaceae bacterium]
MSTIRSNEFLKNLYGYLDNQRNQGIYVIQFFNAAGSRYFKMPLSYANRTNGALEAERQYVKNRSLTAEIKNSFPNPINLDGLAAFIDKNLPANKLAACMAEFGIPSGAQLDKAKFAHALAAQFSLFVATPGDDVDNVVWEMYQTLLAGQQISADDISGPRYAGDDVLVEFGGRRHEADCYEIIHHEWKLQNRGTCEWNDRKLVLVNQTEIHPRPLKTVIPVLDTGPGKFTKIATDIDARGFEGNFECNWEMQDADGENCFPNKRWDFNIRIQVTFHTSDEGDTRG